MLRVFMTGFLEVLICSLIGLSLLNQVEETTEVDILTFVVNIVYLACLVLFCLTLAYFLLCKSGTLITLKAARDRLEHLKLLKVIHERYEAMHN